MKYLMMLLVLLNFSCQSSKSVTEDPEVLVYYSKGRCLGKCPVYDLWVYQDGSFLYSGIDYVSVKGKIKSKLKKKEFNALKSMIDQGSFEKVVLNKGKDRPVTTLRVNGEEYKYYPSALSGDIKELNARMKQIVNQIVANSSP
ncbi:DUF6438 domain-containing protein [Aquimarina spongiae]|uniref:DUF6438 domain-containing protein n=1 Tax=Aquimarina spongiae TaxID=570521 RepID=A0A1M6I7H5_9FLAO|nr:DUF6438 domain-containing protein [Aquimarina spongiae]SHJ30365.1 hypothetical protein SAMN04488508_107164 [Aquimarina spongiae]